MAESKFASLFHKEPVSELTQPQRTERTPLTKPIGRPPGKRSDPEWKQFSVLLRRQNQRKAADILRDRDDPLDLSGLIDTLLEAWIKKQKP